MFTIINPPSTINPYVASQSAGSAYNLTATSSAITFGTTNPVIILNQPGTYLILATTTLDYNAATFAASRTVTMKLRRTNNTAADVANSTVSLATEILTLITKTFTRCALPPCIYITSNIDDSITLFGDVSVLPSAGNLQVTSGTITAIKIG